MPNPHHPLQSLLPLLLLLLLFLSPHPVTPHQTTIPKPFFNPFDDGLRRLFHPPHHPTFQNVHHAQSALHLHKLPTTSLFQIYSTAFHNILQSLHNILGDTTNDGDDGGKVESRYLISRRSGRRYLMLRLEDERFGEGGVLRPRVVIGGGGRSVRIIVGVGEGVVVGHEVLVRGFGVRVGKVKKVRVREVAGVRVVEFLVGLIERKGSGRGLFGVERELGFLGKGMVGGWEIGVAGLGLIGVVGIVLGLQAHVRKVAVLALQERILNVMRS